MKCRIWLLVLVFVLCSFFIPKEAMAITIFVRVIQPTQEKVANAPTKATVDSFADTEKEMMHSPANHDAVPTVPAQVPRKDAGELSHHQTHEPWHEQMESSGIEFTF